MLHKKFKSSKCKTALNLAKSRLKLLKNKKDIQVKQLRREIAQLLQSGKDQTALIRVEHVVREENTMAAFELIEIYSELLVARLPILESQKDCPLDLKEAVTSLIFAAPRCGDIPELQDVRKHLTTKYGKEFVAAATELRPNCGVSRNLVEKLSVKAPDGPTKVKILAAIAEENNIKWEPIWLEDENPIPSVEMPKEQHMEKDGKTQMKPLDSGIDNNLHHLHAHHAGRLKVSSHSQPPASIDFDEALPPTSCPDDRPGDISNTKTQSHSSRIAKSAIEEGRPNWMMEFKDATAAAQAAAESAERASMAARAAAELSRQSNFVGESSSMPLGLSAHGRNEGKNPYYAGSDLKYNNVVEDPTIVSFNQRNPRVHVDRVGAYQQGNVTKGAEVASSTKYGVEYKSERAEYSDDKNTVHLMYNSATQSGVSLPTSNVPKQFPVDKVAREEAEKFEVHPGYFDHQSGSFGDAYDIFSNLNERYDKNHSDDSGFDESNHGAVKKYNSYAKTVMEDDNQGYSIFRVQEEGGQISGSDEQKYELNLGNNIFVSMNNDIKDMNDIKETGAHSASGAVYDESGSSDDDECMLNPAEKPFNHLPFSCESSVRNFAVHQDSRLSISSDLCLGLDVSESFRKSPLFAKLSEPVPLTFDSDGESSGSERELQNEKVDLVILNNDDNPTHGMNSDLDGTQTLYSNANDLHSLKTSSYEATSSREESLDLDQASDYKVVHEAKPQKLLPSPRLHSLSSNPILELENETQADVEDGMELKFGLLPSGRLNQRMWETPYRRGSVDNATSSPPSLARADGGLNSNVSSGEMEFTQISKETSSFYADFDSTNNDSQIVVTSKTSDSGTMTTHETTRTWKDPTGYFYSNDSGSEDDTPKQRAMGRNRPGAGLSRRTKGSATRSVPRFQPSAREHIRDSSSYATEVFSKQTETAGSRSKNTDNSTWDDSPTRLDPQSKVSDNAYTSSLPSVETQTTPSETKIPSALDSNEKASSTEGSTNKTGHVHPKLPDFEFLTAHMRSLRKNRQE